MWENIKTEMFILMNVLIHQKELRIQNDIKMKQCILARQL